MLSFLTTETVRAYQTEIIRAVGVAKGGRRIDAYVDTLNTLQRYPIPILDQGQRSPVIDFEHRAPRIKDFLSDLTGGDPVEPLAESEWPGVVASVAAAFGRLRQYDPGAEAVARSLIARLVLGRHASRAGGSAGSALGLVWLCVPGEGSPDEIAEYLWHEATHQALFVVEMVTPLFVFAADQAKPQVTSAIRREKRDYDLSFHAAAVAIALVEMHQHLGNAARADELAQGLALTLPELTTAPVPLTSAGVCILDEMKAAFDRYQAAPSLPAPPPLATREAAL